MFSSSKLLTHSSIGRCEISNTHSVGGICSSQSGGTRSARLDDQFMEQITRYQRQRTNVTFLMDDDDQFGIEIINRIDVDVRLRDFIPIV